MTSLPSTVRIGHLTYTVAVDQPAVDREAVELGGGLAGFSHSASQRIGLAEGMAPDYAAETLLHEVLHQCLRSIGFDPDFLAKLGDDNIEERTVNALAGVLLATLRVNPALVAYLLEPDA